MSGHPALALPLHGVHRIEASAGTGKTFALALLHLRLVIERALPLRQVLAVTFTEAATQELRERLRRQLEFAVRLANDADALAAAQASSDAGVALTATLLIQRSDHELMPHLAARLRQAVADIDLASVFTIHGWCQRVLLEHALLAGESLMPMEMLTSESALWHEVATALWRQHSRELEPAARLAALFPDVDALARDLPRLARAPVLYPPRADVDLDAATAARANAAAALRELWKTQGADARSRIDQAHASKWLNGNRMRRATLDQLWAALDGFADGSCDDALPHPNLRYLTPSELRDRASKGNAGKVPVGPVNEAIERFVEAVAQYDRADAQARANLLHELREQALEQVTKLKAMRSQRGFDDLIAGVERGLQREGGEEFAAALRMRYPVALVDEFQDTDATQWSIFERLYAGRTDTALFLIGDPKQAIYRFRGGDVDTYHRAGAKAEKTLTLDANFRSRPKLLAAIEALFSWAGSHPFADGRTGFTPVRPGGRLDDEALRLEGAAAPALLAWPLPMDDADLARNRGRDTPPALRVEAARRLAARGTALRIRALLDEGHWQLCKDGQFGPIEPRNIAVLVGNHKEAALVQRELAAVGIPAVTAGRASLFASDEALELHMLLLALAEPGDEGRRRAALATRLLGLDAVALDALGRDEAAHRHWLEQFQDWRARWDRHGPLALLAALVADAAPRLLRHADGERRLTNYLQLAELLQEASARVLGAAGLIEWLVQCIAEADDRDSTQQLRLESDAERVRVMTLHASKGLEFDLVFLPFLLHAPDDRERGIALLDYRDPGSDTRVLHARFDGLDDEAYSTGRELAQCERLAEQLRLLYVGLTRARHALWLSLGAINGGERSALAWLMNGGAVPETLSEQWVERMLQALASQLPGIATKETFPHAPSAPRALPPPPDIPAPLPAQRLLRRDWWVYSFSQLVRDAGAMPEAEQGAEDEAATETFGLQPMAFEPTPFAGARFGNAMHAALERVDFAAWAGWRGASAPAGQSPVLVQALDEHGFAQEDQLDAGSRLLATLVRDTLNVELPEGLRLAQLPEAERRSELEFHFALQPVQLDALLALLRSHGLMQTRAGLGPRERIEGLMTGKIDLVYRHDGRWYVLDYKSNRLADYGPGALAAAMRDNDYELQYVIYTLALHRWLRFRVPGYDYARDFGGVRYLFCRGLDAAATPSPGIVATRLEPALVDQLDRLFGRPPEAGA